MASTEIVIGAAGKRVAGMVEQLRVDRRMTIVSLSENLRAKGRHLGTNALANIENGTRRVDVDDLMALSAVFGVSPLVLIGAPDALVDEPGPAVGIEGRLARIEAALGLHASP